MRALAIGSCMSNLTISELHSDYQVEQTHSVHHNRSDNFIRYFIDKTSEMIPRPYFDQLLDYKPETESTAKEFLENQYYESVGFHGLQASRKERDGNFFNDLRENCYDIILLDNFMDIAAKLMKHRFKKEYEHSPLFLNPGFYANESEVNELFDWYDDYLDPVVSARNWLKIYNWIRGYQPTAKIFFLTYHSCSSTTEAARYGRAFDFYPALKEAIGEQDLHIVPPLSVPESLTEGQVNWPHFKMPIYKALAGYVFLYAVGGWPKLKTSYIPPRFLVSAELQN